MIIHNRTVKVKRGQGLVNNLIDKLPFEWHLFNYQFCGPGTKLKERLQKGQRGINPLDSACREHDIAYSQSKNLQDRHRADADLISTANQRLFAKDTRVGERIAAAAVSSVINVKKKLGMGLRKRKYRGGKIKKGGIIAPLLTGIGAASSLLAGASNIYKNYRALQHNAKMLQEIKKHNQAINSIVSGRGMYLRPYKGKGYRGKKKKKKKY